MGFQTELINDLVSLSCKKTGNVFQGRKFSPAFKRFQCFVKPGRAGARWGWLGVIDICAVCKELFQPPSKPAHYHSMGSRQFSLSPRAKATQRVCVTISKTSRPSGIFSFNRSFWGCQCGHTQPGFPAFLQVGVCVTPGVSLTDHFAQQI